MPRIPATDHFIFASCAPLQAVSVCIMCAVPECCRLPPEDKSACLASYHTAEGQPRVVNGSYRKVGRVWDPFTGEKYVDLLGHTAPVQGIATFNDDALHARVITSSRDHTLKVYDPSTGDVLRTLAGHEQWVKCVATYTLRDGTVRAVSGSHDGTLRVWDPNKEGEAMKVLVGRGDTIMFVVPFELNGKVYVAGAAIRSVMIWDPDPEVQDGGIPVAVGITESERGIKGPNFSMVGATSEKNGVVRIFGGEKKHRILNKTGQERLLPVHRHDDLYLIAITYHHTNSTRW